MPAPAPAADLVRGQTAAHVAMIGAQVSFGLFPVVGTFIFRPGGLTPLGVAAWRLGAGAAILLLLAVARHGREFVPATPDLLRLTMAGWLGVGLNQAFFLEGLARSTPINATLVMCLIPVFTFALAAAVGQEAFSARTLAGVLLALAGLLPLLFTRGLHGLGRHGLGNLLMTANALCYSIFLVVAKPLARRYPPLVLMAWGYALSLPLAAYFAHGERLVPAAGHPGAWWALAYIVAFPTVIAYLLNMFALARVRASTTAIYVYAQPLVGSVASWAAFGETPSGLMLVAAVALFVGVWLVATRERGAFPPRAGASFRV